MFRNVLFVLSVLLASSSVMAQCTNSACTSANADYKLCKYSYTIESEFKKCLCTEKFLVNYQRCLGGSVCAWDGIPAHLNQPCIALYCPGTFAGGFDAKAYCSSRLSTSYDMCMEVPTDHSFSPYVHSQVGQSDPPPYSHL